MPITQFSRIQHRRGKQVDLPPILETSELGHSTDERRLYIGNGDTIIDNAPIAGNTEILTEFSPVLDLVDHTYISNTGVAATTGPVPSNPVVRTLQELLDDRLSIKSYGVLGDGITDDVDAINRAMKNVYCDFSSPPPAKAYRTIYLPAGTYILDSDIMNLPTGAELVGDGPDKTIIRMTNPFNPTAIRTADSNFDIDLDLGTGFAAVLPSNITVRNLTIQHDADQNIVNLDRSSDILFENVKFKGGWDGFSASSSSAVYLDPLGTIYQHNNIRFKNCEFTDCGAVSNLTAFGLDVIGVYFESCKFANLERGLNLDPTDPSSFIMDVKVTNSFFKFVKTTCVNAGNQTEKIISTGNTYYNCGAVSSPVIIFTDGAVQCVSTEDTFELAVNVRAVQNDSKSCLVLNPQTNFIFKNIVITSKAPAFAIPPGITAGPTDIIFDTSKTDSVFLDYTIKRRGFTRVGRIFVATDGIGDSAGPVFPTGTVISDLYSESNSTGITFDYDLTGGILSVVYTSDAVRALGEPLGFPGGMPVSLLPTTPVVTLGDTLTINGILVTFTTGAGTLPEVMYDMNVAFAAAFFPNPSPLVAQDWNGNLEIILSVGPSITISGTGTAMADLSLVPLYSSTSGEFHVQSKSWLMNDTVTQTSFFIDSLGNSMVTDTGEELVFGEA